MGSAFPKSLRKEFKLFAKLKTPEKIQDFLDTLPINFEKSGETLKSPREVLLRKNAHCMEGALFAAAALWYHGKKPFILDLRTTDDDMDHVVALFKEKGLWGAISKTNHAVLRYRDPIYKTIRELVLSYFHEYFLDTGEKTLREYSRPFDLRRYGSEWLTASQNLWHISDALDQSPHHVIIDTRNARRLRRASEVEIRAGKLVEYKK